MVETPAINLRHVARGLGLPVDQIQAVVELLDEGNTVPFITRYRKDHTGGLDEEQIRQVQDRLTKMRLLAERKQTILRSIEAQGKLSEKLSEQIRTAGTTKRLEDLYLPYKPRKQTLATLARSRGLEPLAREILEAAPICDDLDSRAADFVSEDRNVAAGADALLGAGHILAEQFSERVDLRQRIREILHRTGKLLSSQIVAEGETQPRKTAHQDTAPAEPAHPPGEAADSKPDQPEEPSEPLEPTVGQPDPAAGCPVEPKVDPSAQPPTEQSPTEQSPAEQPPTESGPVAPPPAPLLPKPPEPNLQRLSKAQLKKRQAQEKKLKAFRDYFDYREEIKRIPPHRVLAINRGERAKVLRVKIESDTPAIEKITEELLVPPDHPHAEFLRGCARDALSRLILPGLEREIRRELTDRAEAHAVSVFARNLRNLLLQPPVHDQRVLAVDPGFKSGCKLVALDQFGNVLEHGLVYLVGRTQRRQRAKQIVTDLVDRFKLTVVAIGNGTACRETEEFFAKLIDEELKDRSLAYVIVNEAGASVYSTSRLGREEFRRYDATLRSAISIGRRLQDPLSELVKIDPASIGVGLYQHDVKAKHLRVSLDEVVESCVNYVGVNVNTASPALLRYVSGLNQLTARRLYEYRMQHGPFRNRRQLKEVPGLGEATFVQAAGFLQIVVGDHPLDTTWIHPESYEIADRVLAQFQSTAAELTRKEAAGELAKRISEVDVPETAKELGVGALLLKDILSQLARPGRDPREDLPTPIFKRGILKLEDLAPGMELTGTVLNVVDFGAFVDIGMHDSGLVHVSQLADRFIRDPHDVIAVGDIVKVWVVDVDKQRRRVSLTMIEPGTKRSERPKHRHGDPKHRHGDKNEKTEPRTGSENTGRPPRGKRPKPEGPTADKGRRTPKPKFKPKSRPKPSPKPSPKPIVPITDEMKAGAEPMRTFGDLAQFFDLKQDESSNRNAQNDEQHQQSEKAEEKSAKSSDREPKAEEHNNTDDAQSGNQ